MNLTEEEELVPNSIAAGMTSAASNSRSPASVPKAKIQISSAISQVSQFDVRCAKKVASALNVDGGYVQLQGKNCLRGFKEGDLEIMNKSNGYTASVFLRGTDKYQTDLIQLNKGANEITIRYREDSGKTVEEVILVHSSQI